MAEKVYFSGTTSVEKLTDLFGKTFRVTEEPRPVVTVDLLTAIFEGQPECLKSVVRAYENYFTSRRALTKVENVPRPVQPLLQLMRYCHRTGANLFANGAGEQFLTHLLYLSSLLGDDWVVKFSTTSDPRTDWCGVTPRGGSAGWQKATGVTDAQMETMEGVKLLVLVAEVKSASSPKRRDGSTPAECQLLCELRVLQLRQQQPILGLLIDPAHISLYVPRRKKDRL